MKEIKQTKETLEMTPADRTDIIEECNRLPDCSGSLRSKNDGRRRDKGNHRRCVI